MDETLEKFKFISLFAILILATLILIPALWMGISAAWAKYNVWSYALEGEAELKKAEWNRQIAVKEALAKKDAAIALAQAEIERAKGVAEANRIIGASLNNNESYLRYLWIENLQNEKNQVIYVPTEAGLPLLESSRHLVQSYSRSSSLPEALH